MAGPNGGGIRIISCMSALLFHLPALVAAVALVPPPGFCCYAGAAVAGQAPSAPQRSCCDKTAPAPDKSPAPHCPDGVCCCAKDAVTPRDLHVPQFQPDVIAAVVVVPLLATIEQPVAQAAVVLPTGPPLRVLHCVWLI